MSLYVKEQDIDILKMWSIASLNRCFYNATGEDAGKESTGCGDIENGLGQLRARNIGFEF